ncbi:MAG: hypothetical protein HY315_09030, partial [Acidobacteria bacterium]|nr:hypothetical protein [Acidobacteriota bacterium]
MNVHKPKQVFHLLKAVGALAGVALMMSATPMGPKALSLVAAQRETAVDAK